MSDITVYLDNLAPSLSDVLEKSDGSVFDLTGCTIKFKMRDENSGALKVDAAATVDPSPTTGAWTYDWAAGDLDREGIYKAWIEVTYSGGEVQDTPEFTITVEAHRPMQIGSGWARALARQKIRLFGDTATAPIVTDPVEVEFLLDMGRIMDKYGAPPPKGFTWYPGIDLGLGTFVVPSVPNGHYYEVTLLPNAPGYTEPTWPTTSGDVVTQDGVQYTESGSMEWTETFDANYCIAQAWLLKAGRVAPRYNFMVAGKMFSRQQFYDHCMKQYSKYASKSQLKAIRLATPLIGQSLANIPLWNDVPNNDPVWS